VQAILLVQGDHLRFDGDLADSLDGIPGINAKIRENLVDLGNVHLDRPYFLCRHPDEIDILTDKSPEHLQHILDGLIEVEDFRGNGLFPGKSQELPGDICRAHPGFMDLLQITIKRQGRIDFIKGHLRIPEDDTQHVIEIVGHTSGQPTDRFHLLGLLQLGFKFDLFHLRLFTLGDVFTGAEGADNFPLPITEQGNMPGDVSHLTAAGDNGIFDVFYGRGACHNFQKAWIVLLHALRLRQVIGKPQLADAVFFRIAENPATLFVDSGNLALMIEGDDYGVHRIQIALGAVPLNVSTGSTAWHRWPP